jgi:DNA-binding NarL/FixJ family response regulator
MDTDARPDSRVRLAILDGHELLLDSLSAWIAAHAPDFELVLTAPTWFELVQSDQFPTDLVLLDFQVNEPVSIEARVRTCRAAGAKVIVLKSTNTPDARERTFDTGASAFLTKTMPFGEVMETARRVMGMGITGAPVRDWRPLPRGAQRAARPNLSISEKEALSLYASGSSTSEVAAQMNVKYETAKTYLRRVREKYARAGRPSSTKSDLMRRAAEDGYLL